MTDGVTPRPYDDSRRREDAAIRLEQQFADFLKVYANDKVESKEWRITINARLTPLEDLHRTLSTPAKVIGAILLLMITPVAGVLGWTLLKKTLDWCSMAISRIP